MVSTPKPNGFADHYPYEKWLFHWEYTLFSDKARCVASGESPFVGPPGWFLLYPLVMTNIAIENMAIYSGFSH